MEIISEQLRNRGRKCLIFFDERKSFRKKKSDAERVYFELIRLSVFSSRSFFY